jgi:hypothetical protein
VNKRFLAAGLLLMAACASSGDTTTTTADETTTTSTTAAPTTTAAGAADEGCVVGSWTLDLDSFVSSMEGAMGGAGSVPVVSVTSGSASMTFEDNGEAAGVYDDLTVQVELGPDTPVIDMILSGEIVGTWSVEDETLVLTPGEGSNLDVEALVDGEPFPLPIEPDTSLSSSRSAISCEGDMLSITPEVQGSAATVWLRS